MSIISWIPEPLRVVIHGATGFQGRRHMALMKAFGTPVVAGVSRRDVAEVDGVPIYPSVRAAREATGATASVIFLPPRDLAEGVMEAIDQGVELIVAVTEGVPVRDMLFVRERLARSDSRLIGPNTPGLLFPGVKLGFLPHEATMPGDVVLVSRSGTLSYEVARALAQAGIGVRYWIGIGGDPVKGTTFKDVLVALRDEPSVRGVVLVGEIGGVDEEEAADALAAQPLDVPVFACIAGRAAPPGRRMGHAGAIVSGNVGTYAGKVARLRAAGVVVADSPREVAQEAGRRLVSSGGLR